MIQKTLAFFKKYFANKYLLIGVLFAIWMFFFDNSSVLEHIRTNKLLQELKDDKIYYSEALDKTKAELQYIKTSPRAIERIAREKFFLKRSNEDVFIVTTDSLSTK